MQEAAAYPLTFDVRYFHHLLNPQAFALAGYTCMSGTAQTETLSALQT